MSATAPSHPTMLIQRASDIAASDITDENAYLNRRRFIGKFSGATVGTLAAAPLLTACRSEARGSSSEDTLTSYKDITTYNNFFEFGTGKDDPSRNAGDFRTKPWTVVVDGHVKQPTQYDLDDLLRPFTMEERVYRMRCVEAWSMVIPWLGFPLRDLINRVEPTSRARYVAFETLYDPKQMPGQKRKVLDWPYREGLRMDEAMHPLTLMVTGLYGKPLPGQNGAPLRLVVPWKYGFKVT